MTASAPCSSGQGKDVLFCADGFEPALVSSIMKDYGYGFAPANVDKRFKQGFCSLVQITVVADDLPRVPQRDDIVKIDDLEVTVRAFQPVSMGGDPLLYKLFANTDQRS